MEDHAMCWKIIVVLAGAVGTVSLGLWKAIIWWRSEVHGRIDDLKEVIAAGTGGKK